MLILIIISLIVISLILSSIRIFGRNNNGDDKKHCKDIIDCQKDNSLILGDIDCNGLNCTPLNCQCGGKDFKGNTKCCEGSICKKQNDYYSQCIPDTKAKCINLNDDCTKNPDGCCDPYVCEGNQYYKQCKLPKPPTPGPSPTPPAPKYSCSGSPDYKCIKDQKGKFSTIDDCELNCGPKVRPIPPGPPPTPSPTPPAPKYSCSGPPDYKCSPDPKGKYSIGECELNCGKPCPGGNVNACYNLCPTSPTDAHKVCMEDCDRRCGVHPGPGPSPPTPPPSPPTPPPSPPTPSPSGPCPVPKGDIIPTGSFACPVPKKSKIDSGSSAQYTPEQVHNMPECDNDISPTNGPCISRTAHIGDVKLWQSCLKDDGCVEGSKCVRANKDSSGISTHALCWPSCDQTNHFTCCDVNNQCNNCDEIPDGGNYISKNVLNKGTVWKKVKNITEGCFYPDNDSNLWYDDGNACNKALCDNGTGKWIDDISSCTNCNFHHNPIKIASNIGDKFSPKDPKNKTYTLNNSLDINNYISNDPTLKDLVNPTKISLKDNNNTYILSSIKPKDFCCQKFPEWNAQSEKDCVVNCNQYLTYLNSQKVDTKTYDCDKLCKPYDLNDPNIKDLPASTTDFAFGSATSCMCNGNALMEELLGFNKDDDGNITPSGNPPFKDNNGEYWVGVATPSWIQSPFDTTTTSGIATGGSTIGYKYGEKYTSNCSIGEGGCGKCWKLTADTDEGTKNINAVVIDTCEDTNAYGNNGNWCQGQRADANVSNPASKKFDPKGTYAGHFPPYNKQLPYSSTTGEDYYGHKGRNDDNKIIWNSPDCYDGDGKLICKNMDYHPTHFDVAIQGLPKQITDTIDVWKVSTNPKVTAERIDCPDELKKVVTKHCGSKAGSSATPDQYCPGHDDKMYWSPTNPNGLWPANSPGPSPGPGPGPGPSSSPKICYFNDNCQKDYDKYCSTPSDYCNSCNNNKIGIGSSNELFKGKLINKKDNIWSDYLKEDKDYIKNTLNDVPCDPKDFKKYGP